MIWIKFLLLLEIFVKAQATTEVFGNVVQSILPFGNNGGGRKPSYKPPGKGKPSYKAPTQNKPSYKPQGGGGGRKPSYKPPGGGKPSNGGVGGGVIQSLRNLKSQKTSFIQSLLPFGGGGRKPSGGGKPSYKPQNGGGKPSYKPPSPGGGARKPSYQNNLQAPSGGQPSSSSPQSYQNSGNGNISDQEMKQLLVSIHDMMKQIVATQQANAIIASSIPSPSSSAPDSYGTPQASPISGSAPSSYGGPVTSGASSGYSGPSSSSVTSSSGVSNTYSNPSSSSSRLPASAPTDYVSPSASSSSAPDSYGNPQSSVITGSSSSSSIDDPVIQSTYQQLNSILRTYRAIQERELEIEKKPVIFPQKPSFNDILVLLERRAQEKRRDKRQQTAGIQSRSFTQFQDDEESEELRDIEIEAFF